MMALIVTIVNIIISSFRLVIKGIYTIIVMLGLQYVFLYLVACLIVELSTDYAITSNKDYLSFAIVGLILIVILSLILAARKALFKKSKSEKPKQTAENQSQLVEQNIQLQNDILKMQLNNMQTQNILTANSLNSSINSTSPGSFSTENATTPNAFENANTSNVNYVANNLSDSTTQNSSSPQVLNPTTSTAKAKKKQKPKIYQSLEDANYFIYEYQDRYDIYYSKNGEHHFVLTESK